MLGHKDKHNRLGLSDPMEFAVERGSRHLSKVKNSTIITMTEEYNMSGGMQQRNQNKPREGMVGVTERWAGRYFAENQLAKRNNFPMAKNT